MLPGQLAPAALVDRLGIACTPIRDLLVDYLTERAVDVDYTTLEDMARSLAGLFWRDLEKHHPGIDSLRLDADTVTAWKERVGMVRDRHGVPVRPRVGVHHLQLGPGVLPGSRPLGCRRTGPVGPVGRSLSGPRQRHRPQQEPRPPQSRYGPAHPHSGATATRSKPCGRPSKPPRARTSNCDAASAPDTPPALRAPTPDALTHRWPCGHGSQTAAVYSTHGRGNS